jgi:predicted RNA-binding protein YlqC (UPF0109 family)
MSATIDEQFVEYVVKSLVGKPEAVSIKRSVDEKGVLLELTVDAEDLGRVIGKRGATAQSLRTLLRALGTKQEARYNLKIVDVDRLDENGNPLPRPERPERDAAAPRDDAAAPAASDDAVAAADDGFVSSVKADDDDDVSFGAAEDKKESDAVARTRAELADLDDLDI